MSPCAGEGVEGDHPGAGRHHHRGAAGAARGDDGRHRLRSESPEEAVHLLHQSSPHQHLRQSEAVLLRQGQCYIFSVSPPPCINLIQVGYGRTGTTFRKDKLGYHKIIRVVLICVPVHSQKYQMSIICRRSIEQHTQNSYCCIDKDNIFSCRTSCFWGVGWWLKKIPNTTCFL